MKKNVYYSIHLPVHVDGNGNDYYFHNGRSTTDGLGILHYTTYMYFGEH